MKRLPETNSNVRANRKCLKNSNSVSSLTEFPKEEEFGIIESVTVQNFMCHENLTLNFEPHMNFIIGQNGSGKSAILTAIILALGGKSSSTDRFTSIKGFIKSGKNKGKVEVVLRNGGSLAYKPNVYGGKIIITREFSQEGVSSYKIKSELGTICSNQKSELTNILEAMDIMVECPVCVLTQATSKKFLISKDAKAERLFEFFYKGTKLEQLENKYKSVTIEREEAVDVLEKKKQILSDLRRELKKWKKFLDSSKRISDYKNEQIWAVVIELEKRVQDKENQYKKSVEEREHHKRDLELCKKSLNEKNLELDKLNKQKGDAEIEMEECRKKLKELNGESERIASSYRLNKGTLRKLENDKTQLEKDKLDLEKCIKEQHRKDQIDLEEEKNKRETLMNELNGKNANLQEKLDNLKEKINTSRSEQSNFVSVISNLSVELNRHSYELRSIEEKMVATQNAIKSSVNAFGHSTEKVLLEIRKLQNRFRKLPIGPIGMYLDIKDSRWASAVEFATGSSLLDSFCVDNHQDSLILRDILKRFYPWPPSIIVCQFESQIFDVSNGKVQSRFPSVLDILEIKNYLVANCLIDQAQIEKKILVENEREGANLMNNPPRNCHSAYFMNCDQICFNPSRMYSYGKRIPNSRLSAIRADIYKKLEKDREEKVSKIEQLKMQIQTMNNALESLPEKICKLEREVVKITTDIRRNKLEIEELQYREETKNVDCLQENLETICESCEKKKKEIENCLQTISELETKRNELKKLKDDLSDSLKHLNEAYQTLLMKIGDVFKRKESFATGKQKYEMELRSKEHVCKNHEKVLNEQKEKLEMARSRAELTCPRINTDKSVDELDRLIKETEKVVLTNSKCDRESLSKKYQEKVENVYRTEHDLKRMEIHITRLGNMLNNRKRNLEKIRQNTELLISVTFTTILGGNGYSGYLVFDHIRRTLTMQVSPRVSDSVRKNHSSLSGGERSFVTIAFLLALWERTKMPFRILDEYDVFMDASNRQLSVDLLCKKAEEMAQTQFIFLSPLELSRMPASDYIHVLKMAPPKRKAEDNENSPRKKRS